MWWPWLRAIIAFLLLAYGVAAIVQSEPTPEIYHAPAKAFHPYNWPR